MDSQQIPASTRRRNGTMMTAGHYSPGRLDMRLAPEHFLGGAYDLWDMLPIGIYVCDCDGEVLRSNRAAAELLRDKDFLSELRAEIGRVLATGVPSPRRCVRVAAQPTSKYVALDIEAIRDKAGTVVGALASLQDITAQIREKEQARLLAAIVNTSGDAIISKDLNSTIMSWNAGAERLFGYAADEMIGRPITQLMPPERQGEEADILLRIRRGEQIPHFETIRRRKDGTLIDVSVAVSPIRNAEGLIIGASTIARDITENRRMREQHVFILSEMKHRIKNLLAMAGAIVSLSARTAISTQDMASSIHGRLAALARTVDLVQPTLNDAAAIADTNLRDLIDVVFAPYAQETHFHGSLSVSGPDVLIGTQAATGLALVLHELTTNAIKYGALSSPSGRIRLAWSNAGGNLEIGWDEYGGASPISGSSRKGFGTLLLHQIVEKQLGGGLSFGSTPDGMSVRLTIPLPRLHAPMSERVPEREPAAAECPTAPG